MNITGQYRPEYEFGQVVRDGAPKYTEIDRRPGRGVLSQVFAAARQGGLWRFDERWAH